MPNLTPSVNYVISDMFFWPAMAFTTMFGIFIGAVIYDGELKEIKKCILSLSCYALLISTVNLSRVLSTIEKTNRPEKPLASVVTVVLVTIFYLLGMFLGVLLVKKAHPKGDMV